MTDVEFKKGSVRIDGNAYVTVGPVRLGDLRREAGRGDMPIKSPVVMRWRKVETEQDDKPKEEKRGRVYGGTNTEDSLF